MLYKYGNKTFRSLIYHQYFVNFLEFGQHKTTTNSILLLSKVNIALQYFLIIWKQIYQSQKLWYYAIQVLESDDLNETNTTIYSCLWETQYNLPFLEHKLSGIDWHYKTS